MDPYRPPDSNMQLSQKGTAVGGDPFHGDTWQVGSLFSATLDRVKEQVGPFLMLGVGFGVVNVFFSVLNQVISVAGPEIGIDTSLFIALSGSMSMIGGIVQFLLGLVVMMGAMKIARGQALSVSELLPSGKVVVSAILGGILVTCAQTFGFLLFFFPGVILFYAVFFYKWLIVDQEMGPIDAITESVSMTSGHKMQLFIWTLVLFGLGVVSMVLTCGLGLFLLLPFGQVASVLIYDNIRLRSGLTD